MALLSPSHYPSGVQGEGKAVKVIKRQITHPFCSSQLPGSFLFCQKGGKSVNTVLFWSFSGRALYTTLRQSKAANKTRSTDSKRCRLCLDGSPVAALAFSSGAMSPTVVANAAAAHHHGLVLQSGAPRPRAPMQQQNRRNAMEFSFFQTAAEQRPGRLSKRTRGRPAACAAPPRGVGRRGSGREERRRGERSGPGPARVRFWSPMPAAEPPESDPRLRALAFARCRLAVVSRRARHRPRYPHRGRPHKRDSIVYAGRGVAGKKRACGAFALWRFGGLEKGRGKGGRTR